MASVKKYRSGGVCENCGQRWYSDIFGEVIDEHDGCPECKPHIYESLPAGT